MPTIDQLTFGVELEVLLPRHASHQDLATALTQAGVDTHAEFYNHQRRNAWKVVSDASVSGNGAELVSPVLQGQTGFDALEAACNALVGFGCRINRTCGFHVHVGAPNDIGFMKRLHKLYVEYEAIIDSVLAESRRADNNGYCRSPRIDSPRIERVETINELRATNRYRKLNLSAYFRHGTVEFRAHQGTTEAPKALNWVKFCLRMVADAMQEPRAVDGALPEKPVITSRTNMYRQPKFDRLERWAEQGNWDAIRAFQVTGIDTYNKMLQRYKDALLAAEPRGMVVEYDISLNGLLRRLQATTGEVTYFTQRAAYFARRRAAA